MWDVMGLYKTEELIPLAYLHHFIYVWVAFKTAKGKTRARTLGVDDTKYVGHGMS